MHNLNKCINGINIFNIFILISVMYSNIGINMEETLYILGIFVFIIIILNIIIGIVNIIKKNIKIGILEIITGIIGIVAYMFSNPSNTIIYMMIYNCNSRTIAILIEIIIGILSIINILQERKEYATDSIVSYVIFAIYGIIELILATMLYIL